MNQITEYIIETLRIEILFSFGLYSCVLFIIKSFYKERQFINTFDKLAVKIVVFSGLLYAFLTFFNLILNYYNLDHNSRDVFNKRLIGIYGILYWISPILSLLPPLLLRYKKLAKNILFRLLFSLYFLINFEVFVTIIASLNRKSFSNEFISYFNTQELFILLPKKVFTFILFVLILYFFKNAFYQKNRSQQA